MLPPAESSTLNKPKNKTKLSGVYEKYTPENTEKDTNLT